MKAVLATTSGRIGAGLAVFSMIMSVAGMHPIALAAHFVARLLAMLTIAITAGGHR